MNIYAKAVVKISKSLYSEIRKLFAPNAVQKRSQRSFQYFVPQALNGLWRALHPQAVLPAAKPPVVPAAKLLRLAEWVCPLNPCKF